MTDKSVPRAKLRQNPTGKPRRLWHGLCRTVMRLRPGSKRRPDAFVKSLDRFLRRVLRDCWWLSAIVMLVVFLPLWLLAPLPDRYGAVTLAILAPAFGIAALGWIVAIRDSLHRWPGLGLSLTIVLPLGMAMLARIEARKILAQSFGISPDIFAVTLDVLTAVATLWWLFIGVGAMLGTLLIGLLVMQLVAGSGAGGTFLRALATVLPISTLIAMPLASSLVMVPELSDLARRLDGQTYHRCTLPMQSSKPISVAFLSDTQVLAWMPDNPRPAILACALR